MLKYVTAGESHGKGLVGVIEGLPAGIPVSEEYINEQLARRQKGYGRGGRMKIETDRAEIISGVRGGLTLGSPLSFIIYNRDYENWEGIMSPGKCERIEERSVHRPRPGHADLAGAMKYNHQDMRNILERASARETAARVAVGAVCSQLLQIFDIYIYSQVLSIGSVQAAPNVVDAANFKEIFSLIEASPVRCADAATGEAMMALIDQAKQEGESLGGSFELGALGVPPGLGSHVSWEAKLDGRIAGALMSIPAIKAVEIGDGLANAARPGSQVHDQIFLNDERRIYHQSNRAGGLEGGITNGETIWARAYMKPIPTLYKPLQTVNTREWQEEKAVVERSDICAVPAAAVVGEAMLAFVMAQASLEKFGSDNVAEIRESFLRYHDYLKKVWQWEKRTSF
ncbi:MAG: chorismate synthase [Deltaproteobacteria bacterium]